MMRKNLIWGVVVIVSALIQTTWLEKISLQGVVPDLSVLLVIYFALTDGEERAMFTGALGGLFQDVASDSVLGHHVLCLVIIGYAAGRFSTRLVTEHPAVKAVLVFAAGLAVGVLYTGIRYIQDPSIHAFHEVVVNVIPAAFYTAIVTPLIFILLDTIMGRLAASQQKGAA